jgi:5,10-methylenetetrahydromethanopterin reductase
MAAAPTGVVLRDLLPASGSRPSIPARQMVELSREAEALGFQSAWVTEGRGKESFAMLGAMSMATRRIGLGTSILPIFSRPPTVTAMAAATLDDLSGGRLILGLGTGHVAVTESGHGIPLPHPASAMREYVEAVRLVLAGGSVRYQGEVVRIREFQLEFAPGRRVPIFVGALGPRMLRLAGALADGVILTWFPPARLSWARDLVAQGAREVGRRPEEVTIAATARICAPRDGDGARETARRQLASYAAFPAYARLWEAGGLREAVGRITAALPEGIGAAARVVPDAMLEMFVGIGDRNRLGAHLQTYRAAGADLVLAYPVPVGDDAVGSVRDAMRATAPAGQE